PRPTINSDKQRHLLFQDKPNRIGKMTSLTIKVVVTVVATIVFLITGAVGVKKSDPLSIVIAVFIAIPTVLFGFPVCLQALAVLIGQ
ncbi:hypothetical protein, partial [Burkholderia multivorans]